MLTEQRLNCDQQPDQDNCIQTDTSIHRSTDEKTQTKDNTRFTKKRVGPYSYHLNDVIGSGFSSVVYRGLKDNDKRQVVALKVVQLHNMSSHRRMLLENQIRILKMVQHPHIVLFLDIYFTPNNCYIITQYCEGNTLQSAIDSKTTIDWCTVVYQVGSACQYLASHNIMHRDIKPANVLVRNGVWKLGDLGFAQELQDMNTVIKQHYLIGSPLYMPLQSLSGNYYSSKTDSFAMGVFIYYMVARHFPWKGKDKTELIHHLSKKSINKKYIAHLPPRVKHYLLALLQPQLQNRIHLCDCDFEVFKHVKIIKDVNQQLASLKNSYSEQLQLCQYLHYLMVNYRQHPPVNDYCYEFMSRHLGKLIDVFDWNKQKAMAQLSYDYDIPRGGDHWESDEYHWLNNCLKDTIRALLGYKQNYSQVLLQKLMAYQRVIDAILHGDTSDLFMEIQKLSIHTGFQLLRANSKEIQINLMHIDFYQL